LPKGATNGENRPETRLETSFKAECGLRSDKFEPVIDKARRYSSLFQHPVSDEEQEHKTAIDRCFSLLVDAGAKVTEGNQVGDICRRQNPTRPERARHEIMTALAKSGLIPENMYNANSLVEGECKQAAKRYIQLHEQAYRLNEGDEKNIVLADASEIMTGAVNGRCAAIKN
jgi:hypothetical protein